MTLVVRIQFIHTQHRTVSEKERREGKADNVNNGAWRRLYHHENIYFILCVNTMIHIPPSGIPTILQQNRNNKKKMRNTGRRRRDKRR